MAAEGLNRVTLLGNLGAAPELRMTQSGQPILKLRLATSETYLDKDNVRQERTEWHSVTMFGKRGEALAKMLTSGDRICIEGRLSTSSYEKDGEKRYRTEVVATNFVLCGSRGGEGASRGQAAPRQAQREPARRGEPAGPRFDDGAADYDDIPF
ncbi:MAG: single-stranded DNA-binding protein [Kofleriaceae bacterium]|nr:single-stranded DNA-binding protein [Kofleriaceae bacterium]